MNQQSAAHGECMTVQQFELELYPLASVAVCVIYYHVHVSSPAVTQ